ncbi:Oidioi.mRNA.OKI2018_I69.chr2.g8316.t1.cds [Oikopleura dioica]|uniref:carbonic anhydrase n=1 Tax=Oikopleura dioica TaxID=34765 RepID=A0ABN7T9E6_OIKDI|nr:Oidioi.mRNA.OKI2018_I69.chr2.g8316.t1.cds [Oikopleura dioica]
MSWGYERSECPPAKWDTQFPVANGERQSPIDIITGRVKVDKKLKALNLQWKNETASEIFCNGHSVQVTFKPGSTLTGAHLSSEYELLQFHIHWGSEIGQGAEHFINGESGDAEIHFVHWNKKYGSPEEAMKNGDGLAVVGAVIHERDDVEGEYQNDFMNDAYSLIFTCNEIGNSFAVPWKVSDQILPKELRYRQKVPNLQADGTSRTSSSKQKLLLLRR